MKSLNFLSSNRSYIAEIFINNNSICFLGCEDGTIEIISYCPAFSGKDVLERRGMSTSQIVILINLLILFAMLIGFRVIGLMALLLRVRLTK